MKVLVVGSGGREHALCWKLKQSPKLSRLYCAPGNAGIAEVAEIVPIGAEDVAALTRCAKDNAIDLVVVGPEAPLVDGLVDALEAAGVKAFGPRADAAALEGSKAFMKDILHKYNVPTAWYANFTDAQKAKGFIHEKGAPIVVKTSGLAAGKGVILCETVRQAEDAVDMMMADKAFGAAGDEIVIKEYLTGEEASFFALCDGKTAVPLVAAQDHKAVGEGDTGPNAGGMGAYSPAPVFTPAIQDQVMREAILPTVAGMAAEGKPFKGVLFCGLMITADGPRVLEYNVRFGDPECQVLMMRLQSDLLEVLDACASGALEGMELVWSDETALVVVMAAKGYPGAYQKGTEIKDLEAANAVDGVTVFHAGTKAEGGKVLATGGRVLGITARAGSVKEAQAKAYQAVAALDWPEGFCRRDIGWRAVGR